jgi:hypothetical protein
MRLEEHVEDGQFDLYYRRLLDELDRDIDGGAEESSGPEAQVKKPDPPPQKQKPQIAARSTVAMAGSSTAPSEKDDPTDLSRLKCIGCKKMGHGVRSCPSVEKKRGSDDTWMDIKCYHCGAYGHYKPNCPDLPKQEDGDRLNGGGPRQTGESAAGRKP